MKSESILSLIIFIYFSFQSGLLAQCNHQDDYTALRALYLSTGGDDWTDNEGWPDSLTFQNNAIIPEGTDMSTWFGLTENTFKDRVMYVTLKNNGLVGKIPKEIVKMFYLRRLSLGSNSLSGIIPKEIGDLTLLRSLKLNHNHLSGSIPKELGAVSSLEVLELDGNELSGSIPTELGGLPNLTYLQLARNKLTGEIPKELSLSPKFTVIYLYKNQLSGEIPKELANLTNLNVLSLYENELSGPIPKELGNLSLSVLNLASNKLSGSIPKEIGNLNKLTYLILGNNQLTGEIPPELSNLVLLKGINLSSNMLTGEIPQELGDFSNLNYFTMYSNNLSGCLGETLQKLCSLNSINISNNPLLPWEGDFEKFCATDGSEAAQEDAPCNDGNPDNGMEDKIVDCVCTGNVSTSEENIKELIFFPNPVNNQIYIKGLESGKYRMIDLYGRTVVNGHFRHSINVAELMEGMYILQVYNGQHWHTGAIQILRTE